MDLNTWNCCRLCLSTQNLHPIFAQTEHCEKYINVIFKTTGIKVDIDDKLPQQICPLCITFINNSTYFRRKCDEINKILLSRVQNDTKNELVDFKSEPFSIKTEQHSSVIDISHLFDNDFNDCILDSPLLSVEKIEEENIFVAEGIEVDKPEKSVNNENDQIDTNKLSIESVKCKRKKKQNINNGRPKRKRKVNNCQNVTEDSKKDKIDNDKIGVKETIECEYCHKILTSKLSLRNHYKIHTGFDVVCEHCGKKFITRRLLLMHCRAKHGYEKTDKCSFCDYRASNAEQVKIHERLHTGEKPFVCSECGAGFHRKSSYLQHVAIHLPDKTVQCDLCPARFKSVTLMRIHKNRHRAAQYTFQCLICKNSFARRRNATRHLQRVHQLSPDPQHIDRLKIG